MGHLSARGILRGALRRKLGCCPTLLAVDFPGKSQGQSSAWGVSLCQRDTGDSAEAEPGP